MNDKAKAPNFLGNIEENEQISLEDFRGKYLVIYFYPKDKTSGCTVESQNFRDLFKDFQKIKLRYYWRIKRFAKISQKLYRERISQFSTHF